MRGIPASYTVASTCIDGGASFVHFLIGVFVDMDVVTVHQILNLVAASRDIKHLFQSEAIAVKKMYP